MTARLSVAGSAAASHRDIVPRKYRTLQLNKTALKNLLASAVPESSGPIDQVGVEFQVPHPGGGLLHFLIQESPIMAPKLAARYPELKTYVGRSLDDPGTTLRMDVTPRGLHAIVLSAEGQLYIDPYSRSNDTDYISYFKRDLTSTKPFSCLVEVARLRIRPG